VYVEATTEIDADGIAPPALLDDVRDYITTDPDTGFARQTLGLTDATLYVESIIRTGIFVEVNGLTVGTGSEPEIKAAIEANLDEYFREITPFVDGIDAVIDRNDTITTTTVSAVVQASLLASGSSVETVRFGVSMGVYIDTYQLDSNELTKLESTVYPG
jgi:hypothetical protein